jgi:hypothetical protein
LTPLSKETFCPRYPQWYVKKEKHQNTGLSVDRRSGSPGGVEMKKMAFAVVTAVMLIGCATTAKYEDKLDMWLGKNESGLMTRWGAPQQSYESGGRKFLTYIRSDDVYISGTAPGYTTTVFGNAAYNTVGGSPGYHVNRFCQTTFEVDHGKIVDWTWKGNACLSK